MADLRVAHLALGQADRRAGRDGAAWSDSDDEIVEDGRPRKLDRVARAGRGDSPSVEDHQRDERQRRRCSRPGRAADRRERARLERGAADERAVDGRLGHQLDGVLGLDGAPVEDTRLVQVLDRLVRPCASSGVAVFPVPIAQTGS